MIPKIENIIARQIIDSRAVPTIEVDLVLDNGAFGRAAAPSGASTGGEEAKEKRDMDPDRYRGLSVSNAIYNVEGKILPHLAGKRFIQEELDQTLIEIDGTADKSNLGANAILAVSLAFSKALAYNAGLPLHLYLGDMFSEYEEMPRPMFNIINGGVHANNGLSFQEFLIVPQGATFEEDMRCGVEIYHSLKDLLKENGLGTSVGDEGGFAPALNDNEDALKIIREAAQNAGYEAGTDYRFALDIAANEIMDGNKYLYNGKFLKKETYISKLTDIINEFPFLSIEDPFDEKDTEGFIELNRLIGKDVLIIGDDYLVTNPGKIKIAAEEKAVGGVIIKPNQIGTVTETLNATLAAMSNRLITVFSHRSGETEDTGISHLAVASRAPLVKFGAPARGERTSKYNELLRIEEDMEMIL